MLNKYRKPKDLYQQFLFFAIGSLYIDIHNVGRVWKTCPKFWIAFPAGPPFINAMAYSDYCL